jgi:hypothetical protein
MKIKNMLNQVLTRVSQMTRAREKNIKPAETVVEPARETFETIIIDPPWPMTKIERDVRPSRKTSFEELAPAPAGRSNLALQRGVPMSPAAQTLQRPVTRARMTPHPARDMHRVVQKPERHRNSAPRADMTRRPHESMSGRVNLPPLTAIFVLQTLWQEPCCVTTWTV